MAQPVLLVAYLTAVLAYYLALTGWELARTPLLSGELLLFAALLACGAACVEAARRLGMPTGVSHDLLSAWCLPIALLLPPLYALIAPIPLCLLQQLRVRGAAFYGRAFSAVALGLAGGATSALSSHFSLSAGEVRDSGASFFHAGVHVWFASPLTVTVALGCAALFSVLNATLVACAVRAAGAPPRPRRRARDSERLIINVTGVCVGLLITIACMLSSVLLFVALPPVILLQRSLLHQQLRAAARTDAKTGLLNAAAWHREADTEISRVIRAGDSLALLLIDIDHFKRVNDTYGHLVGDQVLAGLADVLGRAVRDADVVGRFGGEEFVVLLPGADAVEAAEIAERVREQVSAEVTVPAASGVAVTVSIGVTVIGLHGDSLPGLLSSADSAMYRAKEAGRNRVCMPDPDGECIPAFRGTVTDPHGRSGAGGRHRAAAGPRRARSGSAGTM
jgi:diguanylate cyclase (GGDEF)-like protein